MQPFRKTSALPLFAKVIRRSYLFSELIESDDSLLLEFPNPPEEKRWVVSFLSQQDRIKRGPHASSTPGDSSKRLNCQSRCFNAVTHSAFSFSLQSKPRRLCAVLKLMPIKISQPLESFCAGELKEDDAKLNKYGLHKIFLI